MNIICTICTELITHEDLESMYSTRCGHIFHLQCMLRWINRSPCCPQCRERVTKKLMFRVYPTLSEEPTNHKVAEKFLNKNNNLLSEIEEKNSTITAMTAELDEAKKKEEELKKQLAVVTAEKQVQAGMLQDNHKMILKLKKRCDKCSYDTMGQLMRCDRRQRALREKYVYQAKRNIEWRNEAKKKKLEEYSGTICDGRRKCRRHSTSSDSSTGDSDSPSSTESESESSNESSAEE